MARIRSVHPGLFTDEVFVTLSPAAQVFWIGLWCEADDHGVFEWKPVTLKMRIIPAAETGAEPLLQELAEKGLIRRYEADGRSYGAVRNFCRHQRPKAPKYLHPVTAEIGRFIALEPGEDGGPVSFQRDLTAAERKRRQRQRERDKGGTGHGQNGTCHGSAVTDTEMSRQMEDGGEEKKDTQQRSTQSPRDRAWFDRLEAALREAAGLQNDPSPSLADLSPILGLIDSGIDLESHILPVVRAAARGGKKGRSWRFYVPIVQDALQSRIAASSIVVPQAGAPAKTTMSDEDWDKAVVSYKRTRHWLFGKISLPPDDPETIVPTSVLVRHGYRRVAA